MEDTDSRAADNILDPKNPDNISAEAAGQEENNDESSNAGSPVTEVNASADSAEDGQQPTVAEIEDAISQAGEYDQVIDTGKNIFDCVCFKRTQHGILDIAATEIGSGIVLMCNGIPVYCPGAALKKNADGTVTPIPRL